MRPLFCRDDPRDSLELRGVRVVDPANGVDGSYDIIIEDGLIASLTSAERAASGLVVAPAFVDPHVHLRTPGREDEETLATGSAAAAAGGYCAIVAMPNTDPPVDSGPVLTALIERAREESRVPMGFMAGISKGLAGEELTEMAELAALGAIAFTDDGHPVASANLMRRALQYSAVADRMLALHCEERSLSRDGQMHEGEVSAELGLAGWPSVAESVMIERDIALARYENRPIHVMHVSARESVETIARGRAAGVDVSGEASPHHLCATDQLVRSLSTNAKMNPPLRAEEDRQALVEAVRNGTISCIATDHAPHALQEKDVPFEEAPFGVTGLETAFAVVHTKLVLTGELALETVIERMSNGPARLLGLPEPGVRVGEVANLVVLDLEHESVVGADGFHSRSTNSWLIGAKLQGAVVKTIADGRLVHG